MLGAAGGIGQPLSLLLKDVDNITELRLYDLVSSRRSARLPPLAPLPGRWIPASARERALLARSARADQLARPPPCIISIAFRR